MEKVLETETVKYILEDDVLTGIYKKNPTLTLEMAKEIVKERLKFTDNRSVVALLYNEGVGVVEKKARDYFTSAEGIKGIKATAVILDTNPFRRFVANFFVSITSTKMPVRIFSKKEAAMKWLQQYRK
jgi:hypothetical protein